MVSFPFTTEIQLFMQIFIARWTENIVGLSLPLLPDELRFLNVEVPFALADFDHLFL